MMFVPHWHGFQVEEYSIVVFTKGNNILFSFFLRCIRNISDLTTVLDLNCNKYSDQVITRVTFGF